MICPSCGFANEDGVLFCEKCKADLEMPAATPSQAASAMNDAAKSSPDSRPGLHAEEPIPLEPITLEPAASSDPGRPAAEPPVELEPVGLEPTIEQGGASETQDDVPRAKPKTASPPPLPQPAAPSATNPKLIVVRGQRMDVQYPLYPGKNYLGRTDDKPVDIDLDDQEAPDRIWTSRQHAVVTLEDGKLSIEDLNSLNGTFVNRTRVHPGQVRELHENDVIQVGTVHLKVQFG
ncbi:MAG TPA: FHA domain-containing protein [Gemmataceae bacterium]|nr:FHA domain-containing protein [Gemmataceae bacterium]